MNKEWKAFLEQQGAQFESMGVSKYTTTLEDELNALSSGTVIADLSHYSVIHVSGEDAEEFLQNQFSNDVRLVTESQAQLSSYCSPKGRMLASFILFKRGDDFYLRLPQAILETTLKRLRMFVLRSKVELQDVSDELARFGVAGSQAKTVLGSVLEALPAGANSVLHTNGVTVLQNPGLDPWYELYGDFADISALWKRLARQATPVGQDRWAWLGIRAGIPEILPPTVEAFVPQMANLAALDGVSFKKGCYPGQEVVARMHYLGKLKRRMYLAHTDGSDIPEPGASVFKESDTEQNVGKVVQAQLSPHGGVDLLAVLQIASSADNLNLDNSSGTALTIQALPYTVTDEA